MKIKTIAVDLETHEKLKLYCALEHISLKQAIKELLKSKGVTFDEEKKERDSIEEAKITQN